MSQSKEMVKIHANLEISVASLQAIVENTKAISGRDERGVYRVDMADKVGEMISKFLFEKDFETYVADVDNYKIERKT